MKLEPGHVAVITGAASGIGHALAIAFAWRGLNLVLADVDLAALDTVLAEARALGVVAMAMRTDVRHQDEVDDLAAAAVEQFGAVDVICNNAGVTIPLTPMWKVSAGAWDWVIDVNLRGVIHGIRSFVPAIVERGSGYVVNTASLAGLSLNAFNAPYGATKHAIVSLSESLLGELAIHAPDVGVTVVCPAYTATNILRAERNAPEGVAVPHRPPTAPRAGALTAADVADSTLNAIENGQLYLLLGDIEDRAGVRLAQVADRLQLNGLPSRPT